MDKSRRSTYIIAAISLIVIVVAIYFLFIFEREPDKKTRATNIPEDVKELNEAGLENKPYVTLTPTSDGAEIIISIENMSYFDEIEYELTYLADNPTVAGEKIERGSTGFDVNTADEKYKKSILLGTGSRGVRTPDTGVTDGKLTLHLFKGDTEYFSESQWDLHEVGLAPQTIEDNSGDFQIEVPTLGKNYFVILAETVGLPPLSPFDAQDAQKPIFGTFSIAPSFSSSAVLSIKTSEDVVSPQLYSYDVADSAWSQVQSTYSESSQTVTASVDSFATFAVVSQ